MTIEIVKDFVPSGKYSIKCPYTMEAEYITVHNTANDASAKNEITYMKNNNNQVSYHFAVDDKEVRQGIPINRNAWHCGDGGKGTGNRKSIGVEICYSKSGGERYVKAEENAVKFIAQLLKERGWGINRIKKHQDWNGKYCPHRILSEGRWDEFKNKVQRELDKLNGVKTKPKKEAQKQPKAESKPKQNVYTGNSIVEYLNSINVDSSFSNRKKLAEKHGIKGYKGTAEQNLQLLDILRDGKSESKKKTKSTPKVTSGGVKAGQKVILKSSAQRYATGEPIPSRFKGKSYTVQQVKSDRVLLKELYSWVKKSDTEGFNSTSTSKPAKRLFKVGDKVRIKSTAKKYSTGQNIPSKYKGKTFTIIQTKSDRVLLKELYSWINKKDIE